MVKGLRNARLGAIGARPGAFNTVRYSEKLLQAYGISVTTVDLSEIIGGAGKLSDDHPQVQAKLEEIRGYAKSDGVPPPSLVRMAKLGIVIGDWMRRERSGRQRAAVLDLDPEELRRERLHVDEHDERGSDAVSACEVDITGVVSMYALQLASGTPSALVDWNNNYADDPDKCVFFHCGNWAKSFVPDIEISNAPILGIDAGRGKHLRRDGRPRARRADDLRPRQHRRSCTG